MDEKLRKPIAHVEAKDFKVLKREEYEKLIKLQEKTPPSPSMSTPDATGTQKKPSVSFPNFTVPGISPIPRLQLGNESNLLNTSYLTQVYNVPKLPLFSG